MDGELVPGGPTDAFLRVTGKPNPTSKHNWRIERLRDRCPSPSSPTRNRTTRRSARRSRQSLHDDANVADIGLSKVETDTGRTDMGKAQRSLNEMPGTSAGNEAINML